MSLDNIVAIVKGRDGKFRGYSCCASNEYRKISDYRKYGYKIFEVNSVEEAISKAQEAETEYGYLFVNLERKERDDEQNKAATTRKKRVKKKKDDKA